MLYMFDRYYYTINFFFSQLIKYQKIDKQKIISVIKKEIIKNMDQQSKKD